MELRFFVYVTTAGLGEIILTLTSVFLESTVDETVSNAADTSDIGSLRMAFSFSLYRNVLLLVSPVIGFRDWPLLRIAGQGPPQCRGKGQIIATSHDLTPKGS